MSDVEADIVAVDGVVLVHGGLHTSACWARLADVLDLPAVAVDLPGRGRRPADPASVTLDDCVTAVMEDADRAGFRRFVLVGHSLGGLTITETAFLHPDRVAALVYVAAAVPLPGTDPRMFPGPLPADSVLHPLPEELARVWFGNDLDDEQWARHRQGFVPEAVALLSAPVTGVPSEIPTIYVSPDRDVVCTPELASEMAARLGPTAVRCSIDAGHSVMVSQPAALAAIIRDAAKLAAV